MVLHPLEFSDCFLDSPWFRSSIKEHEDELEKTNSQIKLLIKDAKAMLLACKKQCDSMHAFSDRLKNFQFEIIGDDLTDAEKGIAGSLKEFGSLLEEIEIEWSRTIERSELQLIDPLERFRKDHIHSYREAKKVFDKSSERFYKQMEQTLGLSHKKKDQHLLDSDNELALQKKNFHKVSLNYVYKLQEVQERKKFEFVEHLLMFMQVYFNFFHQTHETAIDCKDYMNEIQMRLVNTRSQYEGTRDKTKMLMQKMMENPRPDAPVSGTHSPQHLVGQRWARAGYLHLLEKNPLSSRFTAKWTRYFCMYTKENKLFQMLPSFGSTASSSSSASVKINHGALPIVVDPLIVLSCTRRATESIDKRFCFDIEVEDTAGKQSLLTLQALSNNDRKKWIGAMDGKEPNYNLSHEYKKPEEFILNDTSIEFVKCIIAEIERRGVDSEGIYRLVGVSSKVDRLLQLVMDPSTRDQVNYQDEEEWELNTLTSALKNFFRNLPEPIMTFDLHEDLIIAAKQEDPDERLKQILGHVSKLASDSWKVLDLLVKHLVKVASKSQLNKMTVQNIGVCFGPTLMRPKQETVQSIMEIKFNNIIVEMLIENYEIVFVHGCLQKVEKKSLQNQPALDSRPSMRLRTRPKLAKRQSRQFGNLDEDSQPNPDSSKFQRGHAIRSAPKKSTSPLLQRSTVTNRQALQADTKEETTPSTGVVDEFGRISPLDLNLQLDFPLSHSTHPYCSTQSTNSLKQRGNKEAWDKRRVSSQLSGSGDRRMILKPSDSRQSNARTSSNMNDNHNNSCHTSSVSVSERKEMFMNATLEKKKPPVTLPKPAVIRRGSPQTKRPEAYLHKTDHSNTSATTELLVEMSGDNCTYKREPARLGHSIKESGHEHGASFLWPQPGSIKANSFASTNSQEECRPRSTVISSRSDLPPSNPTSPIEACDLHSAADVSSPSDQKSRVFVALYACEAEHDSELSFEPGDTIFNVSESDEPGWLIGTLNGVTGLIPDNYVREKIWD